MLPPPCCLTTHRRYSSRLQARGRVPPGAGVDVGSWRITGNRGVGGGTAARMTTVRSHLAGGCPLGRPFTLTAAAVPVLLGAALARWDGAFAFSHMLALLLAAV